MSVFAYLSIHTGNAVLTWEYIQIFPLKTGDKEKQRPSTKLFYGYKGVYFT